MYFESKELNNVYQETELWRVFLLLKIAVQIGLYVNINVNIRGPILYSFISQECVSVASAFVSDTENMALIWRGFLSICIHMYAQATY